MDFLGQGHRVSPLFPPLRWLRCRGAGFLRRAAWKPLQGFLWVPSLPLGQDWVISLSFGVLFQMQSSGPNTAFPENALVWRKSPNEGCENKRKQENWEDPSHRLFLPYHIAFDVMSVAKREWGVGLQVPQTPVGAGGQPLRGSTPLQSSQQRFQEAAHRVIWHNRVLFLLLLRSLFVQYLK